MADPITIEKPPAEAPKTDPPKETPAWAKDVPETLRRDTPEATLAEVSKSYGELQKKLGEKKAEPATKPEVKAEDKSEIALGNTEVATDDDPPEEIIRKAGLKTADLEAQWGKEGKLTDEQYARLSKARPGLGRSVIDLIVRGQFAESALKGQVLKGIKDDLVKMAGGEAQWQTLRASAPEFVPADEIGDLQRRLNNPKQYKGAMRDLLAFHAEHVKSGGSKPLAGATTTSGGDYPKTAKDLAMLMYKVSQGDGDALATLARMPQEEINKLRS